jgi:hypothetical protein
MYGGQFPYSPFPWMEYIRRTICAGAQRLPCGLGVDGGQLSAGPRGGSVSDVPRCLDSSSSYPTPLANRPKAMPQRTKALKADGGKCSSPLSVGRSHGKRGPRKRRDYTYTRNERAGLTTSTETGFTPGGEPPLVPVPHPGASIRD